MIHKCYTIDIPTKSLMVNLSIHKQIFAKGIHPSVMGLTVFVHYPHQLLNAGDSVKNNWPNRKKKRNAPFMMKFMVNSIEVITRRNTKNTENVKEVNG